MFWLRVTTRYHVTFERIPKFGFAIYLIVWWGQKQVQDHSTATEISYSVIFFICLFTLIPTQVYGSWVLWRVAQGLTKRAKEVTPASAREADANEVEIKFPADSGTATPVFESAAVLQYRGTDSATRIVKPAVMDN